MIIKFGQAMLKIRKIKAQFWDVKVKYEQIMSD